jgi:peptidoglycan/LPS O-acetylase OafA/YrhL
VDRYRPELDGLRAVAVVLVLAYHLDPSAVPGGFLGVSVFFTLSGFLITTLLLAEHERAGRIDLRGFWGRRLRRLAPASLVCIGATVLVFSATGRATPSLRGDALAALGDVANWRFLADGSSYTALFEAPSPLEHMWSLAVEEQFYLLVPLVVAVALRRAGRRGLTAVLVLLALGSLLTAHLVDGADRIYFGTDTRAAEILAGSLLALVGVSRIERAARVVAPVGVAALAAVVALGATLTLASPWVSSTGLGWFAAVSAAAVAGAVVAGPAQRALAWGPLPAVGRVSYGLYLYHWPVYVLFSGTVERLTVTAVLAAASARWLERPIRERRLLVAFRTALPITAVGFATVALAAALAPFGPAGRDRTDLAGLAVGLLAPAAPLAPGGDAALARAIRAEPPAADPSPLRVTIVGGSAGLAALVRSALPGAVEVDDRTVPGCPLAAVHALVRSVRGPSARPWCAGPSERTAPVGRPVGDVAIVGLGPLDRAPFVRPGSADGAVEDPAAFPTTWYLRTELLAALRAVAAFPRVLVVDATTPPDAVSAVVRDAVLASPWTELVAAQDLPATLAAIAHPHRRSPGSPVDERLRVMVVGDSTSLPLAVGLAQAASGRWTVYSAGAMGCPLVTVVATRERPDEPEGTYDCASFRDTWPELLSSFRPDVVLGVASLREQDDQRYVDGGPWHAPGDAAYEQHHQQEFAAMVDLLAPGAVLLLADAPAVDLDRAVIGGHPDRIAAWNATIRRAADAHPGRIAVIPFAAFLAPPASPPGRAERPDGVHLTQESATDLAQRHLVDAVERAVADLAASGRAGGSRS